MYWQYVLLIITLVVAIVTQKMEIGTDCEAYRLCRGSKDESVEDLLTRTEYCLRDGERKSKWSRSYILAFLLMMVLGIASANGIPTGKHALLFTFMAFVVVYFYEGYYRFHSDRIPSMYARKNLDYILNGRPLSKGLHINYLNVPSHTDMTNWFI
jgi:hypothetical protein